MHPRYVNKEIESLWSDKHKLSLWQRTELAVIEARAQLERMPRDAADASKAILEAKPIDVAWWSIRDTEIRHDLNAFLEERLRYLPHELQPYFHKNMTSYDTEEPAFATMLDKSVEVVFAQCHRVAVALEALALEHRYTLMLGRTHGQEAELMTFGKRALSWYQQFMATIDAIGFARTSLKQSKLSGAVGNYTGIDPELERTALRLMGFEPFYGATQIMPRVLYLPLASGLVGLAASLNQIALDIRLGARSGRPLYQEPFAKKQKGSSAMPHKKNTIVTEQMAGMQTLANGYYQAITATIVTWEERAIEQSCVERVAWPDLLHVVMNMLTKMERVISDLRVYPDNMLLEVVSCRGCYAASEAKECLKELGQANGITSEDAYRIVQLAAFNAFETTPAEAQLRNARAQSMKEANDLFGQAHKMTHHRPPSIRETIPAGELRQSSELDASPEQVETWNAALKKTFSDDESRKRWFEAFDVCYLLRNQDELYRQVFGTD